MSAMEAERSRRRRRRRGRRKPAPAAETAGTVSAVETALVFGVAEGTVGGPAQVLPAVEEQGTPRDDAFGAPPAGIAAAEPSAGPAPPARAASERTRRRGGRGGAGRRRAAGTRDGAGGSRGAAEARRSRPGSQSRSVPQPVPAPAAAEAPSEGGPEPRGEEAWERTHLEQTMFDLARGHAADAEGCLRRTPPDRPGERTHSLVAVLMSYFALEAFISMVGADRLGGRYRHYDRMTPEGKWIEVTRLASKTGKTFVEDGRELRALSTLRAWRNMLTHYKGEYEEVEPSDRGGQTRTEALLSAANAARAVEIARTMYRTFYEFDRRSPPRQFIWLNDRPWSRGRPAANGGAAPAAVRGLTDGPAAEAAATADGRRDPAGRAGDEAGTGREASGDAAASGASTRPRRRRRGRRRKR